EEAGQPQTSFRRSPLSVLVSEWTTLRHHAQAPPSPCRTPTDWQLAIRELFAKHLLVELPTLVLAYSSGLAITTESHVGGASFNQLAAERSMPLRISPATCSTPVRSRCADECSCQGTLVTMTPGSKSNRPLSRNELWLCSTFSHHRPTTYSGM